MLATTVVVTVHGVQNHHYPGKASIRAKKVSGPEICTRHYFSIRARNICNTSPETSQEVPPCVIVYAGARVANLYCFAYSPPGPIRLSGKDANLCECRLTKRQYLAAMVKSVVLAEGFSRRLVA